MFELAPNLKPNQKRGRGRPPKYGNRINMANKAINSQGSTRNGFMAINGRKVAKDYKSFQATLPGISGPIRIVLAARRGQVMAGAYVFRSSRAC